MNEVIRNLQELQEILILLHETTILHGKGEASLEKVELLRQQESELRSKIDPEILARFDRLSQVGLAVVRCRHGVCGGCFMQIPKGEVLRLKKQEAPPRCPNCGCFLVLED